jgi:hypothetical protein
MTIATVEAGADHGVIHIRLSERLIVKMPQLLTNNLRRSVRPAHKGVGGLDQPYLRRRCGNTVAF